MNGQSLPAFIISLIGTVIVTFVVTLGAIIIGWMLLGWLIDHVPWIGIPLFLGLGLLWVLNPKVKERAGD